MAEQWTQVCGVGCGCEACDKLGHVCDACGEALLKAIEEAYAAK